MRGTVWLLLWTLSFLWGGSFLFVELALEGLTPLTIVWARVALAALILGLALRLTGQELPERRLWPARLVMGLVNNAVPFVLIVVAQTGITGALASVLNATKPIDRSDSGRNYGFHCRKFAINRRPAACDFSGWNWVPMIVSRPTMAVISPP